jgi:hypothetical protein
MHPPGGGYPGAPGGVVDGVVDVLGLVDELGVVELLDVVEVLGVVAVVAALLDAALTTVAPSAPPSIEPATSRASVPRLRFVM